MTRQRTDDQRKQQIRDAATRCFVRRGYQATRLADIAREAGLSKGGVYFHYRAKEQIFQDILDRQSRLVEERWGFDPVSEQPADRILARLVSVHLRTMEDEPDEVRLFNLLVAMAVQEETFRARLDAMLETMRALYAQVIARGIKDGVFVAGDPEELATSVLSYLHGIGALSAAEPGGCFPLTGEHAAEQVLRMLKTQIRASAVEFADDSSSKLN
ncbi:TetR/AcrR family transcriptional regulator [Pseudenhygromyxa sp. WMMC2535]|uniref:TetR family transcriptional regulator n=1 Tax=Pseudenhygromyxa sp. WMMC2535 TaxID=2712867 RepID=UPI001552E77E|nr:TetR/AcrR family transcriptional regulator [Pseudenhygromyxa sp. WMMC2535]